MSAKPKVVTSPPLRLKWRLVRSEWCVAIAECELFVRELSDGWYVQIDLNVIRSERTTIEKGPFPSHIAAQAWAENRLEHHAKIEAKRMALILKTMGGK